MSISMNGKMRTAVMLGMAIGLGNYAFSYENAPKSAARSDAKRAETRGAAHAINLDPYFAAGLVSENQNEIAAAKLAHEKAKNSEVREFAEMMLKDHQEFLKELEKVAAPLSRPEGERAPATPQANAPKKGDAPAPKATTVAVTERHEAGELDHHHAAKKFLQIKQEIAEECRLTFGQELTSKSGREFDYCYMGQQLAGHMMMADTLKVYERHVSPEFQPLIKKGLETTLAHLKRAKEIMKDLETQDKASK